MTHVAIYDPETQEAARWVRDGAGKLTRTHWGAITNPEALVPDTLFDFLAKPSDQTRVNPEPYDPRREVQAVMERRRERNDMGAV